MALSGSVAASGELENSRVIFGVGREPILHHLPLTSAERKGFFEEQGLQAEINDFGGGAEPREALAGSSVDLVTGASEIRMQAAGQDVRAVVELGRFRRMFSPSRNPSPTR